MFVQALTTGVVVENMKSSLLLKFILLSICRILSSEVSSFARSYTLTGLEGRSFTISVASWTDNNSTVKCFLTRPLTELIPVQVPSSNLFEATTKGLHSSAARSIVAVHISAKYMCRFLT